MSTAHVTLSPSPPVVCSRPSIVHVLPLEVNVDLLMEVVVCVEWFIYGID
jgi:hypothetical protein